MESDQRPAVQVAVTASGAARLPRRVRPVHTRGSLRKLACLILRVQPRRWGVEVLFAGKQPTNFFPSNVCKMSQCIFNFSGSGWKAPAFMVRQVRASILVYNFRCALRSSNLRLFEWIGHSGCAWKKSANTLTSGNYLGFPAIQWKIREIFNEK